MLAADREPCEPLHSLDVQKRSRENRTKGPEMELGKRPKPVLPKNLGARAPTVTDFNPQELARQITLVGTCADPTVSARRFCMVLHRCS